MQTDVKLDLKHAECGDMGWIQEAQNTDLWQAVANAADDDGFIRTTKILSKPSLGR
jgi:hypothetical protein